MRWRLRLSEPVRVSPSLTLRTLDDACAYLLSLDSADRRKKRWRELAGLVVTCANTADRMLVDIFTSRLQEALKRPQFKTVEMPRQKPAAPSERKRRRRRRDGRGR